MDGADAEVDNNEFLCDCKWHCKVFSRSNYLTIWPMTTVTFWL